MLVSISENIILISLAVTVYPPDERIQIESVIFNIQNNLKFSCSFLVDNFRLYMIFSRHFSSYHMGNNEVIFL